MKVASVFDEGEAIPDKYSSYQENLSPPVSWSGAPEGTQSIALLVDDTDAPGTAFVHWSSINLEGDSLAEGASTGTLNGKNDAGDATYLGPKPEAGPEEHHYRFRVFALDQKLTLSPGYDPGEFEVAASGHVLALGQLTGTYRRKSP